MEGVNTKYQLLAKGGDMLSSHGTFKQTFYLLSGWEIWFELSTCVYVYTLVAATSHPALLQVGSSAG